MEYELITIDTNIFDRNCLNLEGGMLGQLSQFRAGSPRLILSEIVAQEVRKHLMDKAREATSNLESAIEKATEQKVISKEIGKQLTDIMESSLPYEEIVENRLKVFIESTRAKVIPADTINIQDLMKSYFSTHPPFEMTGNKKNEFPDAIALLSLEGLAKKNQQKILAISSDKGWWKFASGSEWIDVEEDLAAALERVQIHARGAAGFMMELLNDLGCGNRPEMMEEIDSFVGLVISSLSVEAQADSSYDFELEDPPSLEYYGPKFHKSEGEYDVKIVHAGNNKIVSEIGLSVPVKATANFFFEVDMSGGEILDLGNAYYTKEVELETEILLTLEGNFANDDFEITDVEVTQMADLIDFGEIEPDFGHHRSN